MLNVWQKPVQLIYADGNLPARAAARATADGQRGPS
jgi:hypothetical protein